MSSELRPRIQAIYLWITENIFIRISTIKQQRREEGKYSSNFVIKRNTFVKKFNQKLFEPSSLRLVFSCDTKIKLSVITPIVYTITSTTTTTTTTIILIKITTITSTTTTAYNNNNNNNNLQFMLFLF